MSFSCAQLAQYEQNRLNYECEQQCNERAAYEKGVNDATNHKKMDSSWVSLCNVVDRELLSEKYQNGFVKVLKHAPKIIIQNEAKAASRQKRCYSNLDCKHGKFCKATGLGYQVCMGKGKKGDFCKSSLDCSTGYFCQNKSDGSSTCR